MTAAEADAFAEMYDALGAVARETAAAVNVAQAIRLGVPISELADDIALIIEHVERAYDAAAAIRRRYAP